MLGGTRYADLGDLERRSIMQLLPVPDLLRLSATSLGHRADLLRLMHGDLSVQLSIDPPSGTAHEASFRAFLHAGGAQLVKSLALELPHPVSPTQLLPVPAWPPLPSLKSLSVVCKGYHNQPTTCKAMLGITSPIIATATRLRHLQLSIRNAAEIHASPLLKWISDAAIAGGCSLTDVSIQVSCNRVKLLHGKPLTFYRNGLLPTTPHIALYMEWIPVHLARIPTHYMAMGIHGCRLYM